MMRIPVAQHVQRTICDDGDAREELIAIQPHEIYRRLCYGDDHTGPFLCVSAVEVVVKNRLSFFFRPARCVKKLSVEVETRAQLLFQRRSDDFVYKDIRRQVRSSAIESQNYLLRFDS